ncbi:PAS domain S-box-containing protein/diguanylate cyclase (GGDEF) domain-containing protein [Cryptosporangium aurantiacum]|uniref:PAS domain S-box-containing protein/diguanylate cyclase (GGDEF) domain-containing protein n=1 Tax=Cryptosporangium aurantiacum TaxID=134849 RepID=A0A1M7HHF3_9ACTN|nr:PAS domain S-box-containing protein/diguanylate cyclase (GGDEF) domain-containing protein [Cryptosporangium aurantiacum]
MLCVLAVLRHLDLAGRTPFWVFVVLLAAGAVLQQPEVQRRLSGGADDGRLWLRVGLRIALNTALIYAIGWGAMLAVAHLQILSWFLRQAGSRAWLPVAVCSAAAVATGEVAVAAGLFTYLPEPEVHGVAVLITLGVVTTSYVLGEAVRQREDAEAALRRSEELFRAVVQDGSDIITLTADDGRIVYISPTAERITGHRLESLLGDGLWRHIHPDDQADAALFNTRIHRNPDTEHTMEIRIRHADGEWRWHEFVVRNLLAHPGVRAIVGHHRDVHDRRTAQDRIAHAAMHDALTGLLNSASLLRGLSQALADGASGGYPIGLLFLDLDGFKQVNDVHGHAAGDRMLRTISDVLRRTCRERDLVGRMGGDEFAVVLNGVASAEQAASIADALITAVDAAQPADAGPARVGCSIGIALAEPGAIDSDGLLRHADVAMYASKRRGRNGHEVYALSTR